MNTGPRLPRVVLVVLAVVLSGQAYAQLDPPTAVSPGSGEEADSIEQRCPTFSWGAVPGARAYEIEVYRALPAAGPRPGRLVTPDDRLTTSSPVLRVVIPAPASSWTPSSTQCLERGVGYVWRVREISGHSTFAGDWSEGRSFRVEPEREIGSRSLPPDGDLGGYQTDSAPSGIPQVLAQLVALRDQIAADRAWLSSRLDALESQIDSTRTLLNGRLDTVLAEIDSTKPCTPQRWRQGLCSVLEVEATVCFTLGLGGEVAAEFSVEPGMEISGGGSWHEIPHVEFKANLETPFFATLPPPLPPVPVVLPDIKAGVKAGVDGGIEICIAHLTIPISSQAAAASPFVDQLVTTLEARSGEITERLTDLLQARGLNGERIPEMLTALRNLRGGAIQVDEPLQVLRQGELRDLINTLPIDSHLAELLDDPSQFLPSIDPANPLGICSTFQGGAGGAFGDRANQVCSFVDGMPDLAEVANTINGLPTVIADRVCESIPGLNCSGDPVETTRQCRRTCYSQAIQCKLQCGVFGFACRRQCEQRKDNCVSCCNNSSDPSSCGFLTME